MVGGIQEFISYSETKYEEKKLIAAVALHRTNLLGRLKKGPDAHAQLVSTVATIVTKLFEKDVILTHRCAGINTILVGQYNTD